MKYSGIDLHSNNSVVTVTDEEDRVMAEKRLPNDLATILGFLLPWRDELVGVVVESTYNWYWLVDGLQEAGCASIFSGFYIINIFVFAPGISPVNSAATGLIGCLVVI